MSPRQKYLLFPQRADPRNRTCAALSGRILALELLMLVSFSTMDFPPRDYSQWESRVHWMFLFVVPTILVLVGGRGLASDRKRKLASGCLFLLNLLLLVLVVERYVSMAREY